MQIFQHILQTNLSFKDYYRERCFGEWIEVLINIRAAYVSLPFLKISKYDTGETEGYYE